MGHEVNVKEACNGMRMVFPLFLVVYVFCFSLPLRAIVRWFLLLLSPIAAIACNVIRLIPTVYIYFYSKSTTTADRFHDISGWLMVPLAFLLLMGLIAVLQKAACPGDAKRPRRCLAPWLLNNRQGLVLGRSSPSSPRSAPAA